MDSINDYDELNKADPETVRFHSTFKGIPKMLIRLINSLPFWNVHEDEYAKRLTGNARVLFECVKDCIDRDPRTHRGEMLKKPLYAGLFTYFDDSDFREFGNRLLFLILQRQDEFVFPPHHLDPGCWTDDAGNRSTKGVVIPVDVVVGRDDHLVVLKEQLPPRYYWLTIEDSDKYYGIDSNRPVWVGSGWAYPLLIDYGTRDQFNENLLFGDPP